MSRLEEIKNEFAREKGFEDFNHLLGNTQEMETVKEYYHEIYIQYASECAKSSLKKASEKTHEQYVRPVILSYQEIKNLITNPDNIVLL